MLVNYTAGHQIYLMGEAAVLSRLIKPTVQLIERRQGQLAQLRAVPGLWRSGGRSTKQDLQVNL